MASLKTYLIVKALLLWNYFQASFSFYKQEFLYFIHYVSDYCKGHHETWLIIPGHTMPLSLNNLYNSVEVRWQYDRYSNVLDYNSAAENKNSYKMSWLSTYLKIKDNNEDETVLFEKNIDDFMENFRVCTTSTNIPSLNEIFIAWCIYHKHWYKGDVVVEFLYIDDMGENMIVSTRENNYALKLRNNKIFLSFEENGINSDTKMESQSRLIREVIQEMEEKSQD